jgi:hypothetical protein
MVAPVQLHALPTPRDTSRHGDRYTAQEREEAFLVYRKLRSLRKVEDELDISLSTLSKWSKENSWVERADREDAEDIEAARAAISGQALPALQRGINRLVKIIDNDASRDLDAIKATELLGRYTGTLAAPNAGQPFVNQPNPSGQKVISMKDLAGLDPDQLAAWTGLDPTTDDEAEPSA